MLVSYAAPPTVEEKAAVEGIGGRVLREIRVVPVLVVVAPAELLPRLARAPGVVLIEEDIALYPALDRSRGLVRADVASKSLGLTGKGVTIAVFDSGIDTGHPDLAAKVLASHDATLPDTVPRTVLGQQVPVVPDTTDGHGTHVAGIAAGPGTQSGGRFVGIAPGAGLVNVKVFDGSGSGSSSYVLTGIDWVLERKDSLKVRVLQMSLGGKPTDGTDALSRAVDAVADQGLLTVAAAGNNGPGEKTVGVPGVARRALTVGAVDKSLKIAPFSSRGPTIDGREKPEIVAPGVGITSTLPAAAASGGYYGTQSGTSMAAPHVAGVAALVFEANASLTPAMTKFVLIASSKALGPTPHRWDAGYGWGFLDADAAARGARDPAILGQGAYEETTRDLPLDEAADLLSRLQFEAEKAVRSVPGAEALVLPALAAVALLFRRKH